MEPKKMNWWEAHNLKHGWTEEDLIEDDTDEQELEEERLRMQDEMDEYREDLQNDFDG